MIKNRKTIIDGIPQFTLNFSSCLIKILNIDLCLHRSPLPFSMQYFPPHRFICIRRYRRERIEKGIIQVSKITNKSERLGVILYSNDSYFGIDWTSDNVKVKDLVPSVSCLLHNLTDTDTYQHMSNLHKYTYIYPNKVRNSLNFVMTTTLSFWSLENNPPNKNFRISKKVLLLYNDSYK